MTMGQLPAGESLTFDVDVIVAAGTNGTVYESTSVSAPNDTKPDNNTQTATATVQSYDVGVSVVPAAPAKVNRLRQIKPFLAPLLITCILAGGQFHGMSPGKLNHALNGSKIGAALGMRQPPKAVVTTSSTDLKWPLANCSLMIRSCSGLSSIVTLSNLAASGAWRKLALRPWRKCCP